MNFILIAVAVLGGIGLIAAIVLYVCSKKFAVYEDPRIAQVTELLPVRPTAVDAALQAVAVLLTRW